MASTTSAIGLEKHHHHHRDKKWWVDGNAGGSEKVDAFREFADDYDTNGFNKHSSYPFIPSVNGQDSAPTGHSNGYSTSQNNLKIKKRDDYKNGYDYHHWLEWELGHVSRKDYTDHVGNTAYSGQDTEPKGHPNGFHNW